MQLAIRGVAFRISILALLAKTVEIDFVRLTDYNKWVRIWYELPFEEVRIWAFYQRHKLLKNGGYLHVEFRFYARKDVFRAFFESATPGQFQKMRKSRKMHVLRVENI